MRTTLLAGFALAGLTMAGCYPVKAQEQPLISVPTLENQARVRGMLGLPNQQPMGFFGEGHESNHPHYNGLLNAKGNSCCNHQDCRPTTARWTGVDWEFMVDGKWRRLPPEEAFKVITADVLAKQHRQRWDSQAHVCTTENGATIYCFIPPAVGG